MLHEVTIRQSKQIVIPAGYIVDNGNETASFNTYEEAVHFANMRYGTHFKLDHSHETLPSESSSKLAENTDVKPYNQREDRDGK